MTLKELTAAFLRANGYDGLSGDGCGCLLDDLMPCGEPGERCEAGVRVPCPGPEDCEVGGECDWHVVPSPPIERPVDKVG